MAFKIQVAYIGSQDHPFKLSWNDKGSGANSDIQCWTPQPPIGWTRVGDIAEGSQGRRNYGQQPRGTVMIVKDISTDGDKALTNSVDYKRIWKDSGSGAALDGSFWEPVPHDDYLFLGNIAMIGHNNKPDISDYVCIHKAIIADGRGQAGNSIWLDISSGAHKDVSVWQYALQPRFPQGILSYSFIAIEGHEAPPDQLFFVLDPAFVELLPSPV